MFWLLTSTIICFFISKNAYVFLEIKVYKYKKKSYQNSHTRAPGLFFYFNLDNTINKYEWLS